MSEYLDPATREEMYLDVIRRLAEGETVDVSNLIEPVSRVERYLYDIAKNFTPGSSVTVEPLTVGENGTYTADEGKAYSPVTVNVPWPNGKTTISGTAANIFTRVTQDDREDLVGGIANPANAYTVYIKLDVSVLQVPGFNIVLIPIWYFPADNNRQHIIASSAYPDGNGGLVVASAGWLVSDGSLAWMYLEQGGQLVDVSQYAANMDAELTVVYHPGIGNS